MNPTPPRLVRKSTVTLSYVRLSAAAPVRVQPVPVPKIVPPHDHDYYEISVVRLGEATHRTDAGDSRIARGSVVIIPPGDVHAFERVRGLHVTNLYYLTEWLLLDLNSLWDQPGLVSLFLARDLFRQNTTSRGPVELSLTGDALNEFLRELEDMERESVSPHPSRVYLKSSLTKCLVLLSRADARRRSAPNDDGSARESDFAPAVREVLDDVERCIAACQPFRVHAIARRLGLSPDHLSRVFLAATGRRPMDYFQRRRAQHATVRVLDRARSITDVAYELGYADAAHLSRAFRRYHGMAPREYRRVFERT